jgi:hydrogenase-4 component F
VRTLLFLLAPPLLSAALAAIVRPYRRVVGWMNVALAVVSLGAAVALWRDVLAGQIVTSGPREFLRVDALSVLVALCVGFGGTLAAWFGPGLFDDATYDDAQVRRFRVFGNLFTFTMFLAATTNNVGIMWIAIEATTIASAILIPLQVTKASVEASWKYILISSVGIALAFGGTVLAYFDFVNLVGRQEDALNWTVLMVSAARLHPQVMQLAFVFLLIGYGTKAGLAPMHTWRPDAYSQAPTALAAMMSGVLLAVALYAIIRWETVLNAAVGHEFTDGLLVALGVLSLGIGAFSLVIQRNYKRMLAYSSIEHVGLMCVGLALGPLGLFASMLHLVSHALAKSTTFVLAGRVGQRYQTAEIRDVSGLLHTMPWTARLFATSVLAIIGLPPFGLFMSEFALFRAGFVAGRPWLMGLVLALLTLVFVSMIGHLNRMLYGTPVEDVATGDRQVWSLAPVVLSLVGLVVLGLTLPTPFRDLLAQISRLATP